MVRTSEKQALLQELGDAIVGAVVAETMLSIEFGYDSGDEGLESDKDHDPLLEFPLSIALMKAYNNVEAERYSVPQNQLPRRSEQLIDLLDRYATTNPKAFRGFVRMPPVAFNALTQRLHNTAVFKKASLCKTRKQVAVGLYQLGRSGNGGGVRDTAFACACSVGSVHTWTEKTIMALYEINTEVMTFATDDERAKSAAWVAEKSGVEEWGRGWLVADGTHINLAWKPALNAREHYSYKSDYSFNIALVFLPHSLRIVESVVGHPGSSHDSRVWASGNGIVAKP